MQRCRYRKCLTTFSVFVVSIFVLSSLIICTEKMLRRCSYRMLASSKVFLSDPGVRSRFLRGYFNHKEDPLYVPFVTDAERELASIQFWVAKNTNLKEVSISLRVYGRQTILTRSERIFPFGVFRSFVTSISRRDVPCRPIQMPIP